MPYMLRKRILTQNDLADDATWKADLPDSGAVTAFELRISCKRLADRQLHAVVYPLVDMISRVELIAESTKKVVSLTGRQQDFLNYLDFKRPNPRRHREVLNGGNDLVLYIMGGRSLYDREYGFDMAKLSNAFLNYTYNLHENTPEYFVANDHDITVYQWAWKGPDVPIFKGYFKSRQVLSYSTTGQYNIKELKITPGLPLRRIVVQKLTGTETLGGTWTDYELEVNNGEFSPVRITSAMDWCMQTVSDYGLLNRQTGKVYTHDVDGTPLLPNDFSYYDNIEATQFGVRVPDSVSIYTDISVPPRISIETVGEANYTGWGWGYQGCLLIGFDHEDDGFDLLDTAGMSSLRLLLTEADTDLLGAVALQEIVLY